MELMIIDGTTSNIKNSILTQANCLCLILLNLYARATFEPLFIVTNYWFWHNQSCLKEWTQFQHSCLSRQLQRSLLYSHSVQLYHSFLTRLGCHYLVLQWSRLDAELCILKYVTQLSLVFIRIMARLPGRWCSVSLNGEEAQNHFAQHLIDFR